MLLIRYFVVGTLKNMLPHCIACMAQLKTRDNINLMNLNMILSFCCFEKIPQKFNLFAWITGF